MTVNDLREKLKDLPDDMPVAVEIGRVAARLITVDLSFKVERLYRYADEFNGDPAFDWYVDSVPFWAKAKGPKAPMLVIHWLPR